MCEIYFEHSFTVCMVLSSLGHFVAFLWLLSPVMRPETRKLFPKMLKMNRLEIMQIERSISVLNLFHQKSPKWIYQSPLPLIFPGMVVITLQKTLLIYSWRRGWHLKKDKCKTKIANFRKITKPIKYKNYFLCPNGVWHIWWFHSFDTDIPSLIQLDGWKGFQSDPRLNVCRRYIQTRLKKSS